MATAAFVIGFLALGAAVAYVAFWGGPGGARQAYLTRGRRAFRIIVPILYIALGIAVPALVLADGDAGKGGQGALAKEHASDKFNKGRGNFRQACWSCHTLKASGARGVTGPNLDDLAPLSEKRVSDAIKYGGPGAPGNPAQTSGRMPAGLLSGEDRAAVAYYVSQVAGH
jgi:mono/diheme cytochrome c family protein